MTQIQTLKKGDETIYPLTHMKGVVDDNGNTMDVLLAEAEKKALRKLFLAAGAEYNDTDQIIQKTAPWETEEKWRLEDDGTYTYWEEPAIVEHLPKHYYLNGLGDITEEQMMTIYIDTFPLINAYSWNSCFRKNSEYDIIPRTNIFGKNYYSGSAIKLLSATFYYSTIEVIKFGRHDRINYPVVAPTEISNAFAYCKVNRVIGCLNINNINASNIKGFGAQLINIKTLYLKNLKGSLTIFTSSSKIEKRCILYIIQNATPTSAITITLHPDAYARIANQADILEALEAQPLITLVSA